ncbi:MAG: NAD-dependent epimerase/dehydratase family protein [Aureispira sp.]
MPKDNILVIGSQGQIGTVLTKALRERYNNNQIIASDISVPKQATEGPFEQLDILDANALHHLVKKHNITQIYHLAALLSAKGEQNPRQTWTVNMNGLFNVLEVARQEQLDKVYFPSSIAVFGGQTPKKATPQFTVLQPETMYGITKEVGEHLAQYYYKKFGLDVRSLRYPGLISYQSMPGGGTTDYAVDIFHKAVAGEVFECFLEPDTALPMMYMPDAIRATLELMEAPVEQLSMHYGYNIRAMSFAPEELAVEIKKHLPNFEICYQPDYRQQIAESWVESMDDSYARNDWGWQEQYDMPAMVKDMLLHLGEQST